MEAASSAGPTVTVPISRTARTQSQADCHHGQGASLGGVVMSTMPAASPGWAAIRPRGLQLINAEAIHPQQEMGRHRGDQDEHSVVVLPFRDHQDPMNGEGHSTGEPCCSGELIVA